MNKMLMGAAALALTACASQMQVAQMDAETGRLAATTKAVVVKSEPMALDDRRSLILVTANDFFEEQTEALGYFGEVVNRAELEEIIIREGLIDEVPSVQDKIGIARAARAYEPFLWLELDSRKEGNTPYLQFVLYDAGTMEEKFRAERPIDMVWMGMNDQNTFYPLFNTLLDYIEENSEIR